MKTAIVVAVAKNNVIGGENKLLWHLPADLKHFKNLTTGHCIIMGRKTFESIGRPLPNRINLVVSRSENLEIAGCTVFSSFKKALEAAKEMEENGTVFIIGGGNIYQQAIGEVDEIYLTEVELSIEGDTFFPEIDALIWKEETAETHQPDEKNAYQFTFRKYVRA